MGAAIFGHYGDRIGRKSTLIATLLLMGLATFAVALVPTYDSIGMWGAVILTVLRFIQGVGVGGEWGGSVLMSMEWARNDQFARPRRVLAAIRRPLRAVSGQPCGSRFSQMSGEQFLAWGWRIPFALSIVLVGVGLYIRLGILETPVFAKLLAERKVERTPMLDRHQGASQGNPAFGVRAHGRTGAVLYLHRLHLFLRHRAPCTSPAISCSRAVLTASMLSFVSIPVVRPYLRPYRPQEHVHDRRGGDRDFRLHLFRHAQDRFGADRSFLAIILSLIPHDMLYGPQAALIAESFTGRLRYSGASLGYQLASIIAGGPAPLIAAWLFGTYHSATAIAIYIAACAVITLVATALMTDYTGKDISAEYQSRRSG